MHGWQRLDQSSAATATTADAAAAPTSTPADSQPDTLEPTPTQAAAAQPTETTVPEPTATQPPATQAPPGPPSLPDTPVSAAIDQAYSYTATGNTQLAVTDLPDGLQTVTARWYRGGGRLILVYQGLDLSVSGPVCPGNSIFTTQFEFISNSPTAPGACDGDPSGSLALAGPDAGVRICAGLVSYITEIPDDIAGVVFATINLFPDTGPALGITVSTPTSAGIPEIDPSILSC